MAYWKSMSIDWPVTSKLDSETIRYWEQYELSNELPTLSELKKFLSSRADYLDKINLHKIKSKHFNPTNSHFIPKAKEKCFFSSANEYQHDSAVNLSKSSLLPNYICFYCHKHGHSIYKCQAFLNLPLKEKQEKVKSLKLCFNCLQKNHGVIQCKFGTCRYCPEKHNSLLHPHNERTSINVSHTLHSNSSDKSVQNVHGTLVGSGSGSEPQRSQDHLESQNFSCNFVSQGQVLLATAIIDVKDANGDFHRCKALLDSGSMSNFISKDLAERHLSQNYVDVAISGIDSLQAHVSKACDVQIKSINSNFQTELYCLILPSITDKLPNTSIDTSSFSIPSYLKLADPRFYEPSQMDILIGIGLFSKLLCNGRRSLGENMPILQKSKLGWFISGSLGTNKLKNISCNFSNNKDSLQRQVEKFWEIKELATENSLSEEELQAELNFQQTFQRNNSSESTAYYSPHHAVLREESSTTKLRVVFNSSSPSSSGVSYNLLQMIGPTVQEELLSILLHFRQHTYVVTASICKMYRQILIADEFKALQLILWRASPEDSLQTYSLNTVMYGTASAPFLATRCLKQLGIDTETSMPKVAEVLKRDFYVDDYLSGADSIQDLEFLSNQVISVLSGAGFHLRKWKSNSQEILNFLEETNSSTDTYYFNSSETCKTLGMMWSSKTDALSFRIDSQTTEKAITKRLILSETARIFDPMGLLRPIVIQAKIILQRLWSLKIGWDEEVPQEITNKWQDFRSELSYLNSLSISRYVACKNSMRIELHGFSDASQCAYGACIYLRSINSSNHVSVHLLTLKTRVAPLKAIIIPKLELCGATLLAKLFKKAVHLELVTESSTMTFLESFQRFIARRGKPSHVYSDNGSNFIGANNRLRELGQFLKSSKNDIDIQLGTSLDIKWHFIPAYSPHQGSIWEAGIKSAKHHLLRILTSFPNTLTFENFCTMISQVESVLNSRPLTALSDNPNDLNVLTPSHFLTGRASESLSYHNLESIPTNRLTIYEQLERLKQLFWKRWSVEYVTQLQQRLKWKFPKSNLTVGDMVLIQDNNLPPFKWHLGRVCEVHPGNDGQVRVASINISSGAIKRAVAKLAPLPITDNSDS